MLWIALLTMICATIAQHLGLAEKIAQIGSQVMVCPKCLSFWATLFVLLVNGCNILCAVGLSLFMHTLLIGSDSHIMVRRNYTKYYGKEQQETRINVLKRKGRTGSNNPYAKYRGSV